MNAKPGIVRGECEPGVDRNELLTLFHQATRETQIFVLQYLKISENNPKLAEKLRTMFLNGETEKAREIANAIDI